uniref:SCP domain-containing protein n=1 Tax=Strongyloides papillosus TaxID=174720 RepID=A0A0N5C3Q1_STREA
MKYLLNIKICIILSTLFLSIQANKPSRSKSLGSLNSLRSQNVENLNLKRSKSVSHLSLRRPQSVSNLSPRRPYSPLCNKFTIVYYLYKSKPLYDCNGFFFKWYRDAVGYYNELCAGKIDSENTIPNKAIDPRTLDPEGLLYKMEEFRYPDIIKSNPFSYRIWTRIWDNCDFYCFAAYDFKFLKEGFLTEINEYRRLHEAPPLKVDPLLQKYATLQAKKSCSFIPPIPFKESKYVGYIGAAYILEKASLLVKKMYDKFLSEYNWNSKFHVGGGARYSQLIWRKTRKIGIGVCGRDDHIFVTFLFLPKGGYGNFEKNVRPVGQKHIYLYNFFA